MHFKRPTQGQKKKKKNPNLQGLQHETMKLFSHWTTSMKLATTIVSEKLQRLVHIYWKHLTTFGMSKKASKQQQ